MRAGVNVVSMCDRIRLTVAGRVATICLRFFMMLMRRNCARSDSVSKREILEDDFLVHSVGTRVGGYYPHADLGSLHGRTGGSEGGRAALLGSHKGYTRVADGDGYEFPLPQVILRGRDEAKVLPVFSAILLFHPRSR